MRKLLVQLVERLPTNLDSFKSMRLLSPCNCLNQEKSCKFKNLPIVSYILPGERDTVENQWRKLPLVQWKNEFKGGNIPNNLLKFWPTVFNFKDGAGQQVFKELATVVLHMLSLPTSNAAVERAFSIMNTVKTKIRNQMNLDILQAIMHIKIFYTSRGQCCKDFVPTNAMLTLFNSNMYNKTSETDDDFDLALQVTSQF